MVDKAATLGRNIIDFASFSVRRERSIGRKSLVASPNYCSHCGAWLAEGESEDECSAIFRAEAVPPLKRADHH